MDLIITILPVVTDDLPISPRFTPYDFLSRCKFSTLTTRQPMVEFYLLTIKSLVFLFFLGGGFSEQAARGGRGRCQTFWPPCKVVFFGLATNALNVRNNNKM